MSPTRLINCQSLEQLNLANNNLTTVALLGLRPDRLTYESIEVLDHLTNASLDKQEHLIRRAHPVLLGLRSLRSLILSGNPRIFASINLTLDGKHWVRARQRNENTELLHSIPDSDHLTRQGIFPLTLNELHLAYCSITQMAGLTTLPVLHTINLAHNHIVDMASLSMLRFSSMLRTLNLMENPITEQNNYRSHLICLFPHLTTLDERPVDVKEKVGDLAHSFPLFSWIRQK
ncbi:unnamed protein product [Echinostoma caproni]|uniref:Leucine Rich repeat-containing domain protein n=1 Tax=Echinostoma caproni TaxID=27848 RepID=A0A183B0I1_9TREM|nr:unnamed protein product [Echinostoma caproni]